MVIIISNKYKIFNLNYLYKFFTIPKKTEKTFQKQIILNLKHKPHWSYRLKGSITNK